MAPKGLPYAKPKCEVTASQICKVFKYHFTELPSGLTLKSDEDFTVLEKHMDFFVELWKTDPYVSENVMSAGLHKAFPAATQSSTKAAAKAIRQQLSLIHSKKRSMTSGAKLPVLKHFLQEVQEDENTGTLPIKQSAAVKQPSTSSKQLEKAPSVAELYGFKQNPAEVPVSQVTISDDAEGVDEPGHVAEPGPVDDPKSVLAVEACKGYYFDFNEMCLVRYLAKEAEDGFALTESAKMRAGPNGFAIATFSDGFEQETTVSNLEMNFCKQANAEVRKRPAAAGVKKRPASQLQQSEAESSDDIMCDGQKEAQPAKALHGRTLIHNIFELPSNHKLKLGLFRDKAYITALSPGEEKYKLLINVGSDQAVRNGKNHHDIMSQVWEHVKTLPTLPGKADMRTLVLSLLAKQD